MASKRRNVFPRALPALILCTVMTFPSGQVLAQQRTLPADVPLDPGLPEYRSGPPLSGRIVGTTGMDSVQRMFQGWVDAFRRDNPGADITIVQKAVQPEERIAFNDDTNEVFTPGTAYADKYGYEPFRIRICQAAFVVKGHVSAIGVFVGKGNPITQIALDKLDAMFMDARRRGYGADITTWGQLGLAGEWADKPIHPLGFYWHEDVTANFRELVGYGAALKSSFRVPGEGLSRRIPAVAAEMMATLDRDPYAIGFANFSYADDRVKPLALVDEHGVVGQPVLGDIASGRYPLQRALYIYVNRRPGAPLDPLVKAFLTYILSRDGQMLVARDHYLPLTAAMAAAERTKLD